MTSHDLSLLTCMSRKRWIAVAISTLYLKKGMATEQWAHPVLRLSPAFDPQQHTCFEWSIDQLMQLSPTLAEKLAMQKFPPVGGGPPGTRVCSAGATLPTFTASYRASAGFSEEYLMEKGLFAWLVADCFANKRWLAPLEAAAIMGFPTSIRLPGCDMLATRLVGNSISPFHGALGLHYLQKALNMCLHDEVPLDFQVVCESIKRESAAFAKLVPLNSDGVQEWCQRQSGKRKRPGPAASCEAPAPEVLAISETSSICLASLQQHSQVPDTLPDPRVRQGDPILTGPSGVIDVKGKFWPFMQLYEPLTWRKWCGAQFPDIGFDDAVAFHKGVLVPDDACLVPGHAYTLRFARVLSGNDEKVSGFFDLLGSFCTLQPPTEFISWWDWVQSSTSHTRESLWVTSNGIKVADDVLLQPGKFYVLRLRARLRGGGRETRDNRGKLAQHLQSKGVPEELVEKRVLEIMEFISEEQLASAYRSLEPWAALKGLLNNRMRMVLPSELKNHKKASPQDPALGLHADEDPWDVTDPWAQARRVSNDKQTEKGEQLEPLTISLVPGFFANEDGSNPEVIAGISNGAKGVCLMQADQLTALLVRQNTVSSHECAAVIIGGLEGSAGVFPVIHTSLVVEHPKAGKILLKGSLINFGAKMVSVRKTQHVYDLAPKETLTITFEISRIHCEEWENASSNPIRFIWRSLKDVQAKMISTWARRYFLNKKPCSLAQATSWHCFCKICAQDAEALIMQSGCCGIFVTPKGLGH